MYFEVDRYYNRLLREKIIAQERSGSVEAKLVRGQYRSTTVGRVSAQGQSQFQSQLPKPKNPMIRIAMSKKVSKVDRAPAALRTRLS